MIKVSSEWKHNFLPSDIKIDQICINYDLVINAQSRSVLSGPPCIGHQLPVIYVTKCLLVSTRDEGVGFDMLNEIQFVCIL